MHKRQDNIKVAHSLIQSRRFTDHKHYYTSISMTSAASEVYVEDVFLCHLGRIVDRWVNMSY